MSVLDIKPVETTKNKLKEKYPKLCKDGSIPSMNTCTIIVGSAGSGKSVLINNLLTNPNMWGGYFEKSNIYLISQTGSSDDVVRDLDIPDDNVFEDLMKGIRFLEKLIKINRAIIKHSGAHLSPEVLIIFDDCINDHRLLKDETFKKLFVQNRHLNATVICSVQHYKKIPPMARNQCTNTIIFQDNMATFEMFSEVFAPPAYTRKEMINMLIECTKEPYSFMYINKSLPHKIRYRKTFKYILDLDRLNTEEGKKEIIKEERKERKQKEEYEKENT